MKHCFGITIASLVFVALAVWGLFLAFPSPAPPAEEFSAGSENAPASAALLSEEAKPMFLRSYGGKLALFEGSGRYPAKVYDLWVRSLPSEDQSRLKEGIEVSSKEELRSLLEDYLS